MAVLGTLGPPPLPALRCRDGEGGRGGLKELAPCCKEGLPKIMSESGCFHSFGSLADWILFTLWGGKEFLWGRQPGGWSVLRSDPLLQCLAESIAIRSRWRTIIVDAHTIVSCVYLVSLNYIFHGCRDRSAADLFADVEEEGQEYYDLSWFLVLSHPLFSCGRVKTRKRNAMTLEVSKM